MADKLMAEWFWTDRWMGSSAFLLPMEPRGLYREMLTQAWRRGGRLPNDHDALQRATGCTAAEWKRSWPKIERYWRVDGDSLVNDTQLEVLSRAVSIQEKASERGRKGGKAKAQLKQNSSSAQAVLPGLPEVKPPSPSPKDSQCSTNTSSPVAKATWITPYEIAWRDRWGAESEPPTSELLSGLSAPRKLLGPDESLARWVRFLAAQKMSQHARPYRFAQGLGEWARAGAPHVDREGPTDAELDEAQARRDALARARAVV